MASKAENVTQLPRTATVPTGPLVYQCIADVQGALAKIGIGKDRTASTGKSSYKFRGIDDVYNALAPLLADHGLCILPRMIAREVVERKTSGGTAMFYVTVEAEFDFVAAVDGSAHTIRTFGEAFDTGDKATNKAMSAAYKYAAFMAFAIPTEGDNDSENHTHEVEAGMPDAEWAKLTGLVEATKSNVPALLEYLKIELPNNNLALLNQEQYGAVIGALNAKLSKAAKAHTDAQAKQAEPTKPSGGFGEILGDEIPY